MLFEVPQFHMHLADATVQHQGTSPGDQRLVLEECRVPCHSREMLADCSLIALHVVNKACGAH